MTRPQTIKKTLTANDVGKTGGHQAGILVPKDPEILAFFPSLSAVEKNPRVPLTFREDDGVTIWRFVFIYYNNRLFGGTRNEYRLTWMTRYLRSKNAQVGDELVFSRSPDGRLLVACTRKSSAQDENGVLRLSGGWKIIHIR